jgi:hypothetical protein
MSGLQILEGGSMKHKYSLILVMILAALLLSACKTQVTTSVKKDASGELTIEMGFTADEVKTIQTMGGSSDTCGFADSQGQLPPGVTTRQEQRGDETWCIATEPFTDLDALRALYNDMSGVTINQLDLADGKFIYDVTVDLSGGDQAPTTPFDISWILAMPGGADNNNADSASGSTLTWKLSSGESRTLHAESNLNAGLFGSNWLYIGGGVLLCCLCLIMIVAIVVVVVLVTRRKKE